MQIKLIDNSIYIVPNTLKVKILKWLALNKRLYNITFMTKEEFNKHYFYKIKEEAVLYLLMNTEENLETIRTILSNLYAVSLEEDYQDLKLQKLQKILKELKDNNYLEFDYSFKSYVRTKNILVLGYPFLEPFEKKIFKDLKAEILEIEGNHKLTNVFRYSSLKDEVIGLAIKIRELNLQGISYNKIFLAGVDTNYDYTLKKIFKMFDIPLNYQEEIVGTSILSIKEYLKTKDIEIIKNQELKMQVIKMEEALEYAEDSDYYDLLLREKLAKVSLKEERRVEAVNILNEALEIPYLVADDEYLFVLGFNQNKIPAIYKDEDYLSDNLKKLCGLNTSIEKNKLSKESVVKNLGTVKNIFLSYKLTTLTSSEAKSSLLTELGVEEISNSCKASNYHLSMKYNNYKTASLLDTYYKFHEEKEDFAYLTTHVNSSFYNSYSHDYNKIKRELTPYNLSYSSIDDFAKCPFKYYLKNILKLNTYEESFNQKLGDIFHYVLKDSYSSDFDFDKSYEKALGDYQLTAKDLFFLDNLKEELKFIINTNKEMEKKSFLTEFYGEKKIDIKLNSLVTLKGFIDKVLYKNKDGKDYYIVVDYKTGNVTLNLDYLKEGLYMQLPFYIYLITKGNLFTNPTFVGFFYQMLLQNSKDEEEAKKNLRLVGYASSDLDCLYYLDEDYATDSFVKGLGLTKDGNLKARSKVLSLEEVEEMLKTIDEVVEKTINSIDQSNFEIAPKIIKDKNISCEFCPYQDICFKDPTDYIYLTNKEEVEIDA
ncbi:MAG TPA: PD-(D/E)XK nuclease family protein [Candidatus Onthousia faecavium]|nr:PD-(D/E)XK nuclease family protein [Candidatus Onthousia faecavium]